MLHLPGYAIGPKLYESRKTVVFRGVRDEDGASVVLKMLRSDYPSPRALVRLQHEARVVQRLVDAGVTGVIRVLAMVPYGHTVAAVMEDIDGITLKDLIGYGRLSSEQFLRIAIQVAKTLAAIHDAGVIHRDIKPQNIIVNRRTGEARITDFGVSTEVAHHQQKVVSPARLEGTLAYMAPEQTGRMNRPLDYRCDFYSLGATFYEMLTRRRPFLATDAMELVHSHIAREPVDPSRIDPTVPGVLAKIVMKLLAKMATDRYQSARGLARDLARCLADVEQRGGIEPFEIGADDVHERLVLSHRLYGRDNEVATLLAAFQRVADGRSESVFVGGYSGVGKTALVSEIKRSVVERRGYFVSGKMDQHRRSVPYSVFAQAFGELIRQVLTESDERVAAWRGSVLSGLGDHAAVISDTIPDVSLLVGVQPPAPELPANEATNRFNSLFIDFVRVFATADHPLVIFLDDLQWADSASLKLLERLAMAPEAEFLLLIGAYRNNEVAEDHPLLMGIEALQRAGVPLTHIQLEGLGIADLDELVADATHTTAERARPLAELLQRKTGGNPFFLGELLRALHREKLLYHDMDRGWSWDLKAISAKGFSNNVVEMMTRRICRLPPSAQQMLAMAACIGNRFDVQILAEISGLDQRATSAALWPAVYDGLIMAVDGTWQAVAAVAGDLSESVMGDLAGEYRFVHDRVQQAAYELNTVAQRRERHLSIGRALLGDRAYDEIKEQVFSICNHFAYSSEIVTDPVERYRIAKLSYHAGKKAKRSAAYRPAIDYFRAGIELLGDQMWRDSEGMSHGLAFNLSECVYLSGEHDEAERLFDDVLAHCQSDLERAAVYKLKVVLYSNLTRYEEAIACGVQALACCGISFRANVQQWHVLREVMRSKWQLRGRSVESLESLPELSDPRLIAAIRALNAMAGPAYFVDPNLYIVLVLKMLNLSLAHGNSDVSSFSYAMFGMVSGSVLGDYATGFKFGELALRLDARYGNPDVVAKVHMIVGNFLNAWRNPVRSNIDYLVEGYRAGRVAGDLIYTGYCGLTQLYAMLTYGEQLDHFSRESSKYLTFLRRTGDEDSADCIVVMQRMAMCLQGDTSERIGFGDAEFSEPAFLERLQRKKMKIPVVLYHIAKMRCAYVMGEYGQVIAHGDAARPNLDAVIGMPWMPDVELLYALATLATAEDSARGDLAAARKALKKLNKWAKNAPSNFLQKAEVVRAELARASGEDAAAINAYEVAIAVARKNGFLHDEAMICEVAGRFNVGQGRERMALAYFRDARYAYLRWGASGKVALLESEFPELKRAPESSSQHSSTLTLSDEASGGAHGAFDLHSVMKASQAISSEIVLERLLPVLLNVVIENAGARRGVVLLKRDDVLLIEAEGRAQGERSAVLTGRQINGRQDLPVAVVNYVVRTRESVVLHDARKSARFGRDPYIQAHEPRSVLAAPIVHANEVQGVIYLENNLNSGVFTSDRLEVMRMLSTQIAISIENASLYAEQAKMTQSLSRFVPTEFLEMLGKQSILDVGLGDAVQREMTVMFSDIRSFTALSEAMTPEENFTFLNSYLRRVGPVVREHRGFIDKYIGDAIMALFPHQPEDALHAAIALQRQVRAFNVERSVRGRRRITIGIGLHFGQLMLGTIGEERRLEGTVISDAVNIASRLEGLTKTFKTPILVSGTTLNALRERDYFHRRYLGEVSLRGRSESVALYEIFDSDPQELIAHKIATQTVFEEAIRSWFTGHRGPALAGIEAVLATGVDDAPARYYRDLMLAGGRVAGGHPGHPTPGGAAPAAGGPSPQ